ncbi:MAG: hypothetical protein QM706_03285 [Nitrospira sp.]
MLPEHSSQILNILHKAGISVDKAAEIHNNIIKVLNNELVTSSEESKIKDKNIGREIDGSLDLPSEDGTKLKKHMPNLPFGKIN